METYGKILLIAMPIFLLLVLLEKWYGIWKNKETVNNIDAISSLSSGVLNVTKDVLQIGITILGYNWFLQHCKLFTVESSFLVYVISFITLDFSGYWTHRIQHKNNFFWNYHIIHHSSEEFNLACALRQNISALVNVFSFFLLPAALLGVPTIVIATVAPLHLFAQFWYHTKHINKMGVLEKIIVTPSHHRVHHAINKIYIDKNYGQIFIFWDKLFGTFQKELESEPAVYGITVAAQTWNPIKINFQHLLLLCKDAWHTKNIWDKIRIWFMPTGWRPLDVENKFPIQKINDPHSFTKYATAFTKNMEYFYWLQLIVLLLFISYFFGNIASFTVTDMLLYGLYIFMYVYALTDLMDTNKSSIFINGLVLVFVISIIFAKQDWFNCSNLYNGLPAIIILYHIVSFMFTIHFRNEQLKLKTPFLA